MHFGPRGFLKVYVLHLLEKKPMSGYDLMKQIENKTFGVWRPTSGSIYPALTELEDLGYIEEVKPEETEKGRDRGKKVYKVTAKGEKQLAEWQKIKENLRDRMRRWRAFWQGFFEPNMEGSIYELRVGLRRLERALPENAKLTKETGDQLGKELALLKEKLDAIIEKLHRP
jgi:DNA-binding PadR family transcriptional regulator